MQVKGRRLDSESFRPAWFEFESDCLLSRGADTGRNAGEHGLRRAMNMPCRDQQDALVSSEDRGKRVGVPQAHLVRVRNPRVEWRMMQK